VATKKRFLPDEAKLGMAFLLAIIIFVWGLFYLKEWRITGDTYLVEVNFTSAVGVKSSDPILVGGVRIGKVESVTLDNLAPVVTLRIDEPYRIPIDSEVEVIARSVMGEKLINIRKGISEKTIPPGGTIEGTVAPGLSEMFTQVDSVTVYVQNLLRKANVLFDSEQNGSIMGSLSGIQGLTTDLQTTLQRESLQINRVLKNMDSFISNVKTLSEDERNTVSITLKNLENMSNQLKLMLNNLQSSTTSLGNILTRLDRGEGSMGRLLHDENLYGNMNRMLVNIDRFVSNLDELVVDLKANPERYVKIEIF
tara:strand:+ start:18548 stop:19474 length:927 start_codon:yes stop_codon:yes gene_type:complete